MVDQELHTAEMTAVWWNAAPHADANERKPWIFSVRPAGAGEVMGIEWGEPDHASPKGGRLRQDRQRR